MKNRLLVFSAMILLQACATPRYAYYFDHQQFGRDKQDLAADQKPFALDPSLLIASTGQPETNFAGSFLAAKPVGPIIDQERSVPFKVDTRSEANMTSVKAPATRIADNATPPARGVMNKDLKMAAIFGAAGLVGLLIGGSTLNVLGGISLLIGLVFFVRWLIRR